MKSSVSNIQHERHLGLLIGIVTSLVAVFLLASCRSSPVEDISWFTESTCQAPCWNGITPGVTSSEDVLGMLAEMDFIDAESIGQRGVPWKQFDDIIYFNFINSDDHGDVSVMDGRVSAIRFYSLDKFELGDIGITIGDVISRNGEPIYVTWAASLVPSRFGDAGHVIVSLVNPELGYAISFDRDILPKREQNNISADIEVFEIIYFYPEDYQRLMEMNFLELPEPRYQRFQDWAGYGEYVQ